MAHSAPAQAFRWQFHRVARRAFVFALAVLALGGVVQAQIGAGKSLSQLLNGGAPKQAPAATPQTPHPATPAPSSNAIALPDVASRSEELKRMMRSAASQLPAADQIETLKVQIEDRGEELSAREKEVTALLAGTPSTMELREEEKFWRNVTQDTSGVRSQLLAWANAEQSALQQSKAQQPLWEATLQENASMSGLGPTLDVIEHGVHDLKSLAAQAQEQLNAIVNLQVVAANQDQTALDTLDRLVRARAYLERRLLERDSPPLWRLSEASEATGAPERPRLSARVLNFRTFARDERAGLITLFAVLLLSLLVSYRIHRLTRDLQPETQGQTELAHIARHWIALGFLGPILGGYLLASSAPLPLVGIAVLFAFFPILILLPPLISSQFRLLLYCAIGVYAVSVILFFWSDISFFHKRQLQCFIHLVTVVVFAYLLRPSRVSRADADASYRLRVLTMRTGVVVLAAAAAANFMGFVKLAQAASLLCLYSTFVAISLFTVQRVFTRLVLEGIERPGAHQVAVVRHHGTVVARWTPRLLKWSGALVWTIVTLNLLGLGPWLWLKLGEFFGFRIAGSSSAVTLGGVLGFFLILLVGYAVSSSIRFLVREELLSRFQLSRGLPDLIASTLHYLLLVLVFFFAVNTGGVELNKFTVLTGALGVGVGFGLQNIVNNFISGLILQFERPIHVGDVLDLDGANGTVTHIGIRSSTVKTFQGAEVIVPNANFISGKVVNWTLSNPQRRLDLPVGVAYGSDLKLVVRLLERAATEHETVLTSPEPAAFFMGFGDSSINFELRFWVMQESSTVKVKSEVGLAAWSLLDEAGIEIPFPQRELRLRAVDPEAAALLSGRSNPADTHESTLILQSKRQRAGE
jgi:small-conductance mechanosensitive channel